MLINSIGYLYIHNFSQHFNTLHLASFTKNLHLPGNGPGGFSR